MREIAPAVRERIQAIFANEDLFIANVFRIINKQGQLVKFVPNQPQRLLQERSLGHRFTYIIKGRKMGISSRIFAGDLYACATQKNQFAVCLAQTDPDVKKLLDDKIKPLLRNAALPLGGIERDEYIIFPATNSKYYIGTAGSKKFGRSSDITRYHLSEFAHWQNPEVLTGIEEACTDNAIGRIETTTNGFNHAQILWAASKAGKTRYHPIFLPWYADPSYSMPGSTFSVLGEEEQRLVEAYGLSQDQLNWRRAKIQSMSKPELFPQEYPSNDIEAFISSGRPVFDWISLQRHEQKCSEPRWTGDLRDDGKTTSLIPSEHGAFKVWKMPETGHVYIIGADVAEGLDDGAFSAAVVFDAGTDEQVAEWHGHIAPDLFGDILIDIGRYYNGAKIAPEAWPGPGEVTEAAIVAKNYRNLYEDPETGKGWQTNRHTKQKACLDLVAAVRDLRIAIRSQELIAEMRSFLYNPKGGMDPAPGSFSDRIMAAAIGWQVVKQAGVINYESPKLRDILTPRSMLGGASVPDFKNVMGVRS